MLVSRQEPALTVPISQPLQIQNHPLHSHHRKATTRKPKWLHLLKGVYPLLIRVVAVPLPLNKARNSEGARNHKGASERYRHLLRLIYSGRVFCRERRNSGKTSCMAAENQTTSSGRNPRVCWKCARDYTACGGCLRLLVELALD